MSDNVVVTGVFDLRRWLQKAKSIGQLKEVEGADLKFELGCITDLNAKRGGPALLFKNFKGYGEGFRVHTGSMMNWPRPSGEAIRRSEHFIVGCPLVRARQRP
jgi:3-polyprenyl-4-hydroxybenzoate decarboxylase